MFGVTDLDGQHVVYLVLLLFCRIRLMVLLLSNNAVAHP